MMAGRACSPHRLATLLVLAASTALHSAAMAQMAPEASPAPAPAAAGVPSAPAPPPANAPSATAGARFIESCNQSLERGVTELGCQGPIYRNELERLKQEALSTQNPQLLSFVGDAYGSPRSGLGDIGQAYRWYLLAAVRGDPRAMQRLVEMNRKGQGVPKDNVKALGYARLLERMAQSDTGTQRNVVTVINELGAEMAVEEVALAERFAAELETRIHRQAGGEPLAGTRAAPPAAQVRPGAGLPGLSAVPRAPAPAPALSGAAPAPGGTLPGIPGAAPQ